MMEDFSPEKLIDLMKKNGEWDDDDLDYGQEGLEENVKDSMENPEENEDDEEKKVDGGFLSNLDK